MSADERAGAAKEGDWCAEAVHDGRDRIGSLSAEQHGIAVLDADDTYLGTFAHRVDAIRALREAWRLRKVRIGVAR